eukprot:TRINITY_DN5609_c0_g1_i6.p1 TRINITY_DN5609_c0_g1~~TRINITY_DN5609_c0_g1_i6.p1  ORF type:complete len:548 (-),score=113.54 TRINITY_DN5609_c0_g1_i6:66-1613(-)
MCGCTLLSVLGTFPWRGYAELKKIGEGSFGKAILVQAKDGSKVVCKMVDISKVSAKDAKDAQKEGQVLASLKHPYIVRYRDTFTEHGWFCILMDYCEGGDLIKQIEGAKKGRAALGEEKILRWLTQALLALKYIHDRHILHRDLKPGNFFLSKTGVLKMGDFGIAKVLSCTAAHARTQIGTPYYLSPEVCQEKPYSWGSDVWAMGCILYELCALRVPFDAPSMQGLVQKIVQGPIPSVPNKFSPFVVQVCGQMLSRNPTQRPSVADILKRPQVQAVVKVMLDEANNEQAVIKGGGAGGAAAAAAQPPADPRGGDRGAAYFKAGDPVEYFSSSGAQWVPAVVLKIDEKANVLIDLKPKQWMSREEQRKKLRHRQKEPAPPAATPRNVATPMRHRSPAPSPTPQQAQPQSARYRSPSAEHGARPPPHPAARVPSRSPSAEAMDRRHPQGAAAHGGGAASPMRGRSPSPAPSRAASPSPGVAASPRLRPPGIPKAADHSPLRRRNMAASAVGGAIAGA